MPEAESQPHKTIFSVEIDDTIEAAAARWQTLLQHGIATPYQTFCWSRAWIKTVGESSNRKPLLIWGMGAEGSPVVLLPLCINEATWGRKAVFLGGKHSNFNMMVMQESAMGQLTAHDLNHILSIAAKRSHIDCFEFLHQPKQWQGKVNPFMQLPFLESANKAFRADLLAGGDEMIRSLMSAESRKKLRNKEKRLGEFGPVRFGRAETLEEIATVLQVFLAQKAARFKNQQLANPFADDAVQKFLKIATEKQPDGEASVELFFLKAGERIVSILGGTRHNGRMSGMFTSFDDDPAVARFSPGDLLLLNLVKSLADESMQIFDLGTGDAAYKNDYCQTEESLFDSILPITIRGRIMAQIMTAAHSAKRRIKNNPSALRLLRRFR